MISLLFFARFGHQDKITGIDVLSQERVVTSGARDGSVRIWKIVEESQLVFHEHRCTSAFCMPVLIECVWRIGSVFTHKLGYFSFSSVKL